MAEQKSKTASVRKKVFRVFLIVFLVLAAKITVTILSKPKVTTDYAAKLNELTKPANYNPDDNAAPYYQQAFNLFVEMPEELNDTDIRLLSSPYSVNWPGEFDPKTIDMLEAWLTKNQPAFERIKLATEKSYYWIERKYREDKDGIPRYADARELNILGDIIEAMRWDAIIKAYNGDDKTSFEDILTCYKIGVQKTKLPALMTEQHFGQRSKRNAAKTAMVILDRKQFDPKLLEAFAKELKELRTNDNFVFDLQAEHLQYKERIEMLFARDPLGSDRLAFSFHGLLICMCNESMFLFMECFTGPTRKEVNEQIDELFAMHEALKNKSPWELKYKFNEQVKQINAVTEHDLLSGTLYPNIIRTFEYNSIAKGLVDSSITTIAILLYQAEQGHLPTSLEKLVSAGYLKELPMDPYSDKPLGYIVAGDNFKLYGVGRDFEDNKLKPQSEPRKINPLTDSAFLQYDRPDIRLSNGKIVKYWDTIYWPIKRPGELEEIRRISLEKRMQYAEEQKSNPEHRKRRKRKKR